MHYYRVTKYDPQFRDKNGYYTKDEWTDFSCIGISINGHVLSLSEYEEVEDRYISSIQLFLDCVNSNELRCNTVEKHLSSEKVPREFRDFYNKIHENSMIHKKELPKLLKMIMRNYIWCILLSDNTMIRFGYDFYLYIRISRPCKKAIEEVRSLGLFVEDFKNPWIDY